MNVPTRYLALVMLLIAVPVSAWAIAYRPMNDAVHGAANEIKDRTNKLINYDEVNSQYRKMKNLSKSLSIANNKAFGRIPTSHNAEQWLESASEAALDFGLIVKSVTTAGEREEGRYKILPVDFNVSGKFLSVYKLVQHLEQMQRLTRIDRISIRRVDDENVEARIVVNLAFGVGEEK